MKAVIYTGTRNIYDQMIPAIRSLVTNTEVDKIYLMIEDDAFPFDLPPQAEVINAGKLCRALFPEGGPNWDTRFRPLCMMRAACARVLPKGLDRVLQLDVDTIVTDSLDEIFETSLRGKLFAAVPEHLGAWKPYGETYWNAGVMLLNLSKIRKDGVDEQLVEFLNTEKVPYIDQDAWNALASDKGAELPVRYNECFVTGYTDAPAIVHYAGIRDWYYNPGMKRVEYLDKYKAMLEPWRS